MVFLDLSKIICPSEFSETYLILISSPELNALIIFRLRFPCKSNLLVFSSELKPRKPSNEFFFFFFFFFFFLGRNKQL